MRLQITGRHVHVTRSMKEYAREKLEKLTRYFKGIHSIQATLDNDKRGFSAELVIGAIRGKTLVAHAHSPDMYAAIDLVIAKGERLLVKIKGKLKEEKAKGVKKEMLLMPTPESTERLYDEKRQDLSEE